MAEETKFAGGAVGADVVGEMEGRSGAGGHHWRAEILAHLTPDGTVFHAGTLSGNPLAMAAGIATSEWIRDEAHFDAYSRHQEPEDGE